VRVAQATNTAHQAFVAIGQVKEAYPQQAGCPCTKSVKETCRDEFQLYLSMCADITINDMAPTGAVMEAFWKKKKCSVHYDSRIQTDLWKAQLCWLSQE